MGTREIPPLPMSISTNSVLGNSASSRRRRSFGRYGYPPYVKWGTISDSAESTYGPEVTGDAKFASGEFLARSQVPSIYAAEEDMLSTRRP